MDSPDAFAQAILILLGVFVALIILYVIPSIIIWWKLYNKAGEPGWAAIVPVYSSIMMAKIGGQPVGLGIAAGVAPILPSFMAQQTAARSAVSLVGLVLFLVLLVPFSKRYDRGVGFWVLAVLLPIVAVFLVGKATFTGGPAPLAENVPPAAPTPPPPATPPATPPV